MHASRSCCCRAGGAPAGLREDCEGWSDVPEAAPAARGAANSERFCETQSPFLTQFKCSAPTRSPRTSNSRDVPDQRFPEITAIGHVPQRTDFPVARPHLSTGQKCQRWPCSSRRPRTANGCISWTSASRKRFSAEPHAFQADPGSVQRPEREHGARAEQQYGATTAVSAAWQRPQAILRPGRQGRRADELLTRTPLKRSGAAARCVGRSSQRDPPHPLPTRRQL